MSYVDKPYLQTQFENFKQKIAAVFAKKEDIPTKTSDLDNDSGFVTSQYPVEILDEEQTEANTTPDKYVSDAMVTRNLITRMGGLDFKYEDGIPKWSPRGADTWSPFKKKFDDVYSINVLLSYNYYISLPSFDFTKINVKCGTGLYVATTQVTIAYYNENNQSVGNNSFDATDGYSADYDIPINTKKIEIYAINYAIGLTITLK